ncbi:MAG: ROK family protein [Janthinobacterium lividum]
MSGEAATLHVNGSSSQHVTDVLAGIDIGGTKTAVVLSANMPDVLWREEFETLPSMGPDHAVEKIIALLRRALAETGTQPSAIGISCGSPLDRVRGIIQRPPNLPTWDEVQIKQVLEQEFGVPCFLENDANAGAVAEHQFGAGKGCQHMVFLTMGTGLGAGLILNGRIFHGASAMAGEIGHIRLTETGPEGFNKAGSVEGWASGGGMAQHAVSTIREAIRLGQKTLLAEYLPHVTARDVGVALLAGDAVAATIVRHTGVRLGEALAMLVDLLNPERIVIGGLALRLGEALLEPARARMREEALEGPAAACTVLPASLGERIGDVAALCVAMGLHG